MRAQDHNGLEVVSLDGKVLLGWLMNERTPHGSRVSIQLDKPHLPFPGDYPSMDDDITGYSVCALVLVFHREFNVEEQRRLSPEEFRIRVESKCASYAEQLRVPETDALRFHWTAFGVTPEQHEQLFDLDRFVPAELGGRDRDNDRFAIEARKAEAIASALSRSPVTPGVPETMARLLTR